MPLINCPECGKEISDKANSCPNCGCPIYEPSAEYDEEIEETEKELSVSVASLVCYVLMVLFNILSRMLNSSSILISGLLAFVTIILVIISFTKKGKCVCANIVFWINTIAFGLWLVIGVISAFCF